MPAKFYYVVISGQYVRVYSDKSQYEKEVTNFPNKHLKKFRSMEEALRFIDEYIRAREMSQVTHFLKKCSMQERKTDSDTYSPESTSPSPGSKQAIVYTNGACSNNGLSEAKAGIGVFWGKNDPKNVSAPLTGHPTNNRAEIHAAIIAIKQAKEFGYESVVVHTSSEYLIKSMTSWVKKWSCNGWRSSKRKDVENKKDIQELQSVMDGIKVNWEKVSAHWGILGNEAARKLAVQGAAKV